MFEVWPVVDEGALSRRIVVLWGLPSVSVPPLFRLFVPSIWQAARLPFARPVVEGALARRMIVLLGLPSFSVPLSQLLYM